MSDYSFDNTISKEVLCNYLSRAVTAADLYLSDTIEDDLRVIKKIGAKLLGRASGIWFVIMDDDRHFELSRKLAEKVHDIDPEIILQSCVFEAVFSEVNNIKMMPYLMEYDNWGGKMIVKRADKGEYDFAVSLYGTLSSTYCHDRFPRSGSRHKKKLIIPHDNTVVKILYKFIDNDIKIEMI